MSMDYSRLRLPWKQLERGQGFFIPCLDFEKTREYVLIKAVGERIIDAQAIPGIKDGVAGVWFFRKPRKTAVLPFAEPP
jgi:hypothetical protein